MEPSYQAYREQASRQELVPVSQEWLADTVTPVQAYWQSGGGPGTFLLESAGGSRLSRYSFIGLDPWLTFQARGDEVRVATGDREEVRRGNSLVALKELFSRYRLEDRSDLPGFWGGGVGYFAYDWARSLERLPCLARDDRGLPDCWLMFPRQILIFDQWRRSLRVVIVTRPASNPAAAYEEATGEITELKKKLAPASALPRLGGTPAGDIPLANMPRGQFLAAVARAKEYILAGEIFQVVLSQRWELPFGGHPLAFYRALRYVNPSPYLFYLDFGPMQLAGSSPEMLVRVQGDGVETNPIAGTRPRGRTAATDHELEADLLADPKERAEHVMLVDLGRNDLGKVCAAGSVQVDRFMEIEKYSHVMHIVSRVRGKLAAGFDGLDVLAACFPAGTVSGAPKVRAMEIIEELEPVRRGPYAGAVGYVSLTGYLDTCLTIRTMMFMSGRAYAQAGAGVVAGSRPEAEYQETLNKAQVLFRALEMATGQMAELVV